ncbi:ficolin-2-like [Ostrea edulis]|uniref:ficolin-2-like n=1 Tax=Ostrea edulis TaxID=37623 RepID=UPI0024AF7A74|nr:ficolin-2-like [Ostrea edulis]
MSRLYNTDYITSGLERLYCVSLFLNVVFLTEGCTNYSSIRGERYIGPVVSIVTMVGPQQCVKECLARPTVCGGVNYKRTHFLCEIVTSIDKTEPDVEYVRIRLNDVSCGQSECISCLPGEKCVRLSSSRTHCIRDDYAPADCTAIYRMESSLPSGLYQIKIPAIGYLNVFCEMKTDGGGWTVFQRRLDGSEDFYRTWSEYKNGFGNLTSEFWLGNDKLHYLLSQGEYEFRVDMGDFNNQTRYVKYTTITIGNEASKYVISLTGFSGNVDDCFTSSGQPINNMKFSTKDQDNDVYSGSCAVKFSSGWWHRHCHCSNPNGLYLAGATVTFADGITYHPWHTHYYSLKNIQLMVRKVV